MAHEPAFDVRVIGSSVQIEVCKKVEAKYRLDPKDTMSVIYARALEDSVRDVELTADDYVAIAREIERNKKKREAKRAKEKKSIAM